jgi:hypothetical protein
LVPVLTRIAVALERIAAQNTSPDPTRAYREAMTAVVDVAKTAIAPQPSPYDLEGPGNGVLKTDFSDPQDAADPNEVWLGPEFVRDVGAIYDPSSDDPFGLPGIKAEAP